MQTVAAIGFTGIVESGCSARYQNTAYTIAATTIVPAARLAPVTRMARTLMSRVRVPMPNDIFVSH